MFLCKKIKYLDNKNTVKGEYSLFAFCILDCPLNKTIDDYRTDYLIPGYLNHIFTDVCTLRTYSFFFSSVHYSLYNKLQHFTQFRKLYIDTYSHTITNKVNFCWRSYKVNNRHQLCPCKVI